MYTVTYEGLSYQEVLDKHAQYSANKYDGLWYGQPGEAGPTVLNIEDAPEDLLAQDRRNTDAVNPFVRPETADRLDILRKENLFRGGKAFRARQVGTQTNVNLKPRDDGAIPEWDHFRFVFEPSDVGRDADAMTDADFEEVRRIIFRTFRTSEPAADPDAEDPEGPQRPVIVWPYHDDNGLTHIDVFVHRNAVTVGRGLDPRYVELKQVKAGGKNADGSAKMRTEFRCFTNDTGDPTDEITYSDYAPLTASNTYALTKGQYINPQMKVLIQQLYEAGLPFPRDYQSVVPGLDEAQQKELSKTPSDRQREVDEHVADAGGRPTPSRMAEPTDEEGRRVRRRLSPDRERLREARREIDEELKTVTQELETAQRRQQLLTEAAVKMDHAEAAFAERDDAIAERDAAFAERDAAAEARQTAETRVEEETQLRQQAVERADAAEQQARDAQESADEEAGLRQEAERQLGRFQEIARTVGHRLVRKFRDTLNELRQEQEARQKAENSAASLQEEANQYMREVQDYKRAYDRTAAELDQVQKDRDRYAADVNRYADDAKQARDERDTYRQKAETLDELAKASSLDEALTALGDHVPAKVQQEVTRQRENASIGDRLKKARSIKSIRDLMSEHGQPKIAETLRKADDAWSYLQKIGKREGAKALWQGIADDDPEKFAEYLKARGVDVRWGRAPDGDNTPGGEDDGPDDDGDTPSPDGDNTNS